MLIVVVEGTIFQPTLTDEFCCCRTSPFPRTHQHPSISNIIMTYCLKGYWSRIRNVGWIWMDTCCLKQSLVSSFCNLRFDGEIIINRNIQKQSPCTKERNIFGRNGTNKFKSFACCNSFSSARKEIKTRGIKFMNANQDWHVTLWFLDFSYHSNHSSLPNKTNQHPLCNRCPFRRVSGWNCSVVQRGGRHCFDIACGPFPSPLLIPSRAWHRQAEAVCTLRCGNTSPRPALA